VEGEVQRLIVSCNKDGMDCLRQGQHKAAFDQFKYAEAILLANQLEGDNTAMMATTCNNLGCYYKKIGKYHGALSYLRRALKMEVELHTNQVTLAGTHLNLCAILSKLEKHDKAVQHALVALDLMNRVIGRAEKGVHQDDYTVLAIAYHNVGLEREFLEQWDQAATSFRTGYEVAKRFLGEQHALSITLNHNCDAVLRKARQRKVRPGMSRRSEDEEATAEDVVNLSLPPLPGASNSKKDSPSPRAGTKGAARAEAADWVRNEEALWASFATKTLRSTGEPAISEDVHTLMSQSDLEDSNALKPQPLTAAALASMQDLGMIMPQAYDMGLFRFQERQIATNVGRNVLEQALDENPHHLMDIIDAEGEGEPSLSTPNDFRPNRSMKRSTRTSRVVRRTGVFNSTVHRDKAITDMSKTDTHQRTSAASAEIQRQAASKIQRTWRAWFQYCQNNSEWMTVTWICATMIQSHWRSYHVRRQKQDKLITVVQKRARGILVRRTLKWHTAAVTIQKRMIGILTRMKIQRLHKAATHMQRLVRGGLARRNFATFKKFKLGKAIIIQRYTRNWLARRRNRKIMALRAEQHLLDKATIDLQRMFRGWKGRGLAAAKYAEYMEAKRVYDAATRVQSNYRRKRARLTVQSLRTERLEEMEKAATFLRKVYLGAQTKKKYRKLKEDFRNAEGTIIIIQRYMRGCLCRTRLWNEAVRSEEQNWAAIEIQRHWRGYRGRVKWEETLERVWRRETSASVLQRNLRGWLARVKVNRRRRKIARAEFERARLRFRAAQKIQALARGVLTRRVRSYKLAKARHAATQIQRIHRGGTVRAAMWKQVRQQRATIIQAAIRGFLVGRRMRSLLKNVITVQRGYRRWLRKPQLVRQQRREAKLHRRNQASKIQSHFRQFAERRNVKNINQVRLAAAAA